ncbi:MAG: hypothetical protein ACSLE9_07365 [Burkholderiaceae bacterium]
MNLSIIVTDSGPLITLAVAQALDALLAPKLPVIVPDMVRFEVIRDIDKPGAREVADWIRSNEPGRVRVASTEVFEEFEILRRVNSATKTNNRGEQSAAEVLSKELELQDHGAILVFEDSMVRKSNFLIRLPDEVVVTSTSEFLFALEEHGFLTNAAAVLARAVDVRGNEILNRHLTGTSENLEEWPQRIYARPTG